MGLVHDGELQHINHLIRCFWWHFERCLWASERLFNNRTCKPAAGTRHFAEDLGVKWERLEGGQAAHVSGGGGGRWRRSSVSAEAYGATLTTEVRPHSGQILTCFTASVHVTYNSPANLRADGSPHQDKGFSSLVCALQKSTCLRVRECVPSCTLFHWRVGSWRSRRWGWAQRGYPCSRTSCSLTPKTFPAGNTPTRGT